MITSSRWLKFQQLLNSKSTSLSTTVIAAFGSEVEILPCLRMRRDCGENVFKNTGKSCKSSKQ